MTDPRLPHGISEAELEGRVKPLFKNPKPYVVSLDGVEVGRYADFEHALGKAKGCTLLDNPGHIDVVNEDELDLDHDGLTQAEREALREEL